MREIKRSSPHRVVFAITRTRVCTKRKKERKKNDHFDDHFREGTALPGLQFERQ